MKNSKDLNPLPLEPAMKGTKGFNSQLSGHAKENHAGTSGFGVRKTNASEEGKTAGQEEGGRARQPTTSIVGKTLKED